MSRSFSKLVLLAAGVIALGLAGAVNAQSKPQPAPKGPPKFYKWVDDQGKVHYTEHLPTEATGKSMTTLNRQGTPVKETDRALTAEERRAQQEEAIAREEKAKVQREEERKNLAVMSSYSSEKDIDSARERALTSNADVIKSASHNVETALKRKKELAAQRSALKDRPLPPKLSTDIESNETNLRDQQQLLDSKKREADQINARYDEDKRRFQRLTKPATTAAITPPTP